MRRARPFAERAWCALHPSDRMDVLDSAGAGNYATFATCTWDELPVPIRLGWGAAAEEFAKLSKRMGAVCRWWPK